MNFENLKLNEIDFVIKYCTILNSWNVQNRKTHIIGISYSGDELHDFGDKKFSIKENCIFFLNQKDDYSVTVNEKCLSHSIHFTTLEPIEEESFCIRVNSIDELSRLFEKAERFDKSVVNRDFLLASCFYQICAEFNSILQKKYYPIDKRMVIAREYLYAHFSENDCLDNLYSTSNISRRQFDTLFKKVYGLTPNRFVVNQKIAYAKKLLKNSNLPIFEIAKLCGFCDVYYFSSMFKKETGCSPSSFRKS